MMRMVRRSARLTTSCMRLILILAFLTFRSRRLILMVTLRRRMTEIWIGDSMSEIVLICKFGKKILEPFTANKATEAMSEEEEIINSTEGQDAAIQDTEAAEDI